jgi:predicted nucleotidyltransferase
MVLPPPEKMAVYRATARQRQIRERDRLKQRFQLGRTIARRASHILKHDFQADRVVLFGSMLSEKRVHDRSDVDLAVWGLDPKDYFRGLGQLLSLEPDISVDLIDAELAPPRILQDIESQGIEL